MTAPFRFPRFFVTSPQPCPYLPGRQERKVFTELSGPHASELNDALGRIGFRRSQSVAYRPSCAGCSACVSVRVVAHAFEANATQRKLMRRHADQAGLHLSVRELLDQLAGIEETVLLYHDGGKGRPRVQRMLTDTTPTQQKLADLFDIHQYAPTR